MTYCNVKIETLFEYYSELCFRDACGLTQAKAENFLAIAKLTLSQHNIVLFNEEIIKKKSGFGIDCDLLFVNKCSAFFFPVMIGERPANFKFYNNEKINETINDVLYKIYRTFCNMNDISIAKYIDEFKDEINFEKNIKDNTVFSFIKNYNPPEYTLKDVITMHYNFNTEILSKYFSQLIVQKKLYLSDVELENLLKIAKVTLNEPYIILCFIKIREKPVDTDEYMAYQHILHSPFLFFASNIPLPWVPTNSYTQPTGFVFCDNKKMNEVVNDFIFQLYLRFEYVDLDDAVKPKLIKEEIMKKDYEKRHISSLFVKDYDLSKKIPPEPTEHSENSTYINPLTIFD